jgi:crossover junction endodeoxyribonuclease RusA
LEIVFPIEFVVDGTPVSSQAKRPESRNEWKDRVKAASRTTLPEGHWASEDRIAVTLFYFPAGPGQGDVDNIVKLVLDALCKHIYMDDAQVERVLVQKFEPGNVFPFSSPSRGLETALSRAKPVLYVRLSNDPFEDLI